MILITGGAYQGKSFFAGKLQEEALRKGMCKPPVTENIHLLVAAELKAGRDPYLIFDQMTDEHPDMIFTVDELGCGIVPADAFDREWRETTGRICCRLAQRAEAVYRMTCGIAERMK
ncbi:MAG: bifunctional adenosylcobinamide kinase/adenosylcobinamide-phosphate guanylyltransferase [Clostridiales bacterium]|nr:bifunctional adenosylcobinamide kinase/adenosylcobinamide-phosphate guanylyltransferase [Clostridiales bacterium]